MKPIPFNVLAKQLRQSHTSQKLVEGVAIDSRNVMVGDLFFALPGNQTDGHCFLEEVALKNAAGAIVSSSYTGSSYGLPLLYVDDVLLALQELARLHLAKSCSKVIGITGSLGKTTTKDFAAALLGAHFRVFASPRSYNSQATLPLSILMAAGNEDYLILEMGMTHQGNIQKLLSIAPPDIALITTVALQHASNFPDGLLGIGREKASIFTHPKTTLGLLHHDMPHFEEAWRAGSCPKKSFSIGSDQADYFLDVGARSVCVHTKGELPFEIPLELPMHAHYQNFLAAVALARTLDVPWSVIRDAAPYLRLPPMRFEKMEKGGVLFINDAYNANPDSCKAALESLPKPDLGGQVIAVFGEMDALGSYSEEGHAQTASIALKRADYLLCLGPRCETMRQIWQQAGKPARLFEKRDDLEVFLKTLAKPGDVVLLKGARVHALDQIVHSF